MKNKWLVTGILLVTLLLLAVYSARCGDKRQKIVYREHLDDVAAIVNGRELTLRDVAFYVAYEENQVEEQARAYHYEDTSEYWRMRTDHTFIRIAARNAAIQMAVHDAFFYDMAMEQGITLTVEEEEALADAVADVWADLTDDGKEAMLGVGYEDISVTVERMIYAEKMQYIYEELLGGEKNTYAFSSDAYAELLDAQKYKIYEQVWGRVDFGNVTLHHE